MSAVQWAPEAEPQSREAVERAPRRPEVVAAAKRRCITSIVHFTTFGGLKGILASNAVKSRKDLPEDETVKYVYEPNAVDRRLDRLWHDYVNLSVTAMNRRMFNFSAREHRDTEWVILEFSPEILGDGGVVFCTTNNIYPAAHRCRGLRGFKQMFAASVPGRYGSPTTRGGHGPHETTDPQAEVLYPFELPLEHLHRVIVPDDDVKDAVKAARSHFRHEPKIKKDPEAFR